MTHEEVTLSRVLHRNDGGVWGEEPTGIGDTVVLRSTDQTADGRWAVADPALRTIAKHEALKFRLEDGDLLVTKSSGSAIHIGKATIVDADIAALKPVYSNFMQRLRLEPGAHPTFYWYVLRTARVREQLLLFSNTTTGLANISGSILNSIRVPRPPLDEQRQIAEYLDRETGKIDELISKQEELVTNLTLRRQAVITALVTSAAGYGADATGASGTQTTRLDRVSTAIIDCLHTTAEPDEAGDYIVVRTSSVKNGKFLPALSYTTDHTTYLERIGKGRPEVGDVLLTREAPSGEACLVPTGRPVCLGQRMVLVKIDPRAFHPQLMVWNMYMPHVRQYLDLETSGSTVQNLTIPRIRRLPMVVPELARQSEIVASVHDAISQGDQLITKALAAVTLLRERRAALISAAVTGKIEVRTHHPEGDPA